MLNIGTAELSPILLKPHLRDAGGKQWREIWMATQTCIVRRIDIDRLHAIRRSGKAGRYVSETLGRERPDFHNLPHTDEAAKAATQVKNGIGSLLTYSSHCHKLLTRGHINVHHNSGGLFSTFRIMVAQRDDRSTR